VPEKVSCGFNSGTRLSYTALSVYIEEEAMLHDGQEDKKAPIANLYVEE
jgi:hypothetical protein